MKRIFLIANVLLTACAGALAQSADEALKYSSLRFGGTARGIGVAGAFGAMGADYTSILSNPGGLGLFRKSEIMFSFQLEQMKFDSQYDGFRSSDERFNFNVPNIGLVFSGRGKSDTKWKALNFGIGYHRLANFHADRYYSNSESDNSILSTYRNELNGTAPSDISYGSHSFEAVMSYDAYLINPLPNDNTRYSTVADNTTVNQRIILETRGALDELSFALATNYDNKLYFGGYIGIPFLYSRERYRHLERNNAADTESFDNFELRKNLNAFGVGVNLKMGLIYRPSDWVRIGAAFHTPTRIGIEDRFTSSVTSKFDTANYSIESPFGEFNYNLSTPMRFVGSLGVIVRKYGFISFDYEWVNYSRAQYSMSRDFRDFEILLNNDISTLYGHAHIFRTGAEVVLEKFRLRAGYAHYGSPYDDASLTGGFDGATNYFTGGFGVRWQKVYLDFAYVRSHSKSATLSVNDVLAQDEISGNRFLMTTGFRF